MASIFANYLIVDWSAASEPRTGADSIWICWLQVHKTGRWTLQSTNPDTRARAFHEIRQHLRGAVKNSQASLAGFDFPLGYPSGFAAGLGREVEKPWRAVWKAVGAEITDLDDNTNNRFEAAARLNLRFGGEAGPFWGCPATRAVNGVGLRKPKQTGHGLPEMRIADSWLKGPQSPWKLNGAGSVGGQALTGIPLLARLRDDPELEPHTRVWPFETGLAVPFGTRPDQPRVVLAEVWPSLLRPAVQPGEVKDQVQVEALAQHLAKLDHAGRLARLLAGPRALNKEQRDQIEREEGWILGVL